jgi:FkbM family methyltransferase
MNDTLPQSYFGQLRHYLSPAATVAFDAVMARCADQTRDVIWPQVIEAITEGNDLLLSRRWRFESRRMLPILLHEILGCQDYYFDLDAPCPRIIDAGANIGLATFFFKRAYKDCRLELIEPNPVLCDVLQTNLDRNGFNDVRLHRAALYDRAGRLPFHLSRQEDPASTLIAARAPRDAELIDVETLDIRSFLTEPVSLLKLDIEGAEAIVLNAAADLLHNCAAIYCETHALAQGNTLPDVLRILEAAGFEWAVARSPHEEFETRLRFSRTIGRRRSYAVFARRRMRDS